MWVKKEFIKKIALLNLHAKSARFIKSRKTSLDTFARAITRNTLFLQDQLTSQVYNLSLSTHIFFMIANEGPVLYAKMIIMYLNYQMGQVALYLPSYVSRTWNIFAKGNRYYIKESNHCRVIDSEAIRNCNLVTNNSKYTILKLSTFYSLLQKSKKTDFYLL